MTEHDPLVAASHLTNALRENTAALRAIKRRYRVLASVLVVVVLVLVVGLKNRYDVRVEACSRDNQLRSGLLHVADSIEANGRDNPETRAFVADLRRDFATRECDIPWI